MDLQYVLYVLKYRNTTLPVPVATVINFHVKLLHLTKAISFIVFYIVTFYRFRLLIDIIIFLVFNSGLSVFIKELLLLLLLLLLTINVSRVRPMAAALPDSNPGQVAHRMFPAYELWEFD